MILTREDPLLPLAQLRARGQLLEIRQDDLRFNVDECADFLQRVRGFSLSPVEIGALERHTEGWIAGLQLAALSMQGRSNLASYIQAFTGSSRFILDYLIEEVFKRQSAEVQDFLLRTSILGHLSASLCDTVVEISNSQHLLEMLEQANLFIIPLDQSRSWYRYHRLFAELLRHRLRSTHPELEGGLHLRASLWFESQGLAAEAIQHALAAQDWERSAGLMHHYAPEFLKRGEVLTVTGWFQAVPEAYLSSNPQLCFDYCWPLLLASHYDLAAPLLDHLEGAAQGVPTFLGEIYAAQAYLARGLGDNVRLVERSQWALERLPHSSLNSRQVVAMNLGLAYWHQGKMDEAEKTLSEAMETARMLGNHYAALTSLIFLGRVSAVRGRLRQAEEQFRRALQMGNDMPINTLAYMDLATLHYEWNQLEQSQDHLQKAFILCQRMQNDEFLAACWLLTSRLRIAQGDLNGAGEALEQAWALARSGKIPETMVNRLYSAQVRWLIQKGQSPGGWALKLTDQIDCHPFYRFLGVTRALTLPHAQARAYLERLAQVAQAQDWGYGLVAVRVLQASLAPTSEEGVELCCKTLRLAEAGGYIRSFVEAGERIIPFLRLAAGRGVLPEYVEHILAAMMDNTALATSLPSMTEPLSERELEVLRLIAVGMSNREIADELVISPGTAKTHVHHLCGKLGVRNRTEAAMRAKELGLV